LFDFFGLFEHEFVYLGAFPIFIHKTVGNQHFNDMKDKQTTPQAGYPNPPIGFIVIGKYVIGRKQKHTADTKNNEMLEQSLFLSDSVACIFV
jgi:hypothetical protein